MAAESTFIGDDVFTSRVVDSLFVGETENIGNPVTPEEKAYGRSLHKRLLPDFPIRGYEYYDYRPDVWNTTFVNFEDNKQRGAGALSWLLFTGAGVTTENTVKGAKYVNAKPVYFPKIDPRFDSDNRGAVAYRTAAIHDLDGTTTGIPDSYVLINDGEDDSVATDDTCQVHPTWNAAVCTGDIGRIQFTARRPGPTRGAELALKDVAVRSAASAVAGAPARVAAAPQQPITLSRNGKDFKITERSGLRWVHVGLSAKQQARAVPAEMFRRGRGFQGRVAPDSPGKACGRRVQAQHAARYTKQGPRAKDRLKVLFADWARYGAHGWITLPSAGSCGEFSCANDAGKNDAATAQLAGCSTGSPDR